MKRRHTRRQTPFPLLDAQGNHSKWSDVPDTSSSIAFEVQLPNPQIVPLILVECPSKPAYKDARMIQQSMDIVPGLANNITCIIFGGASRYHTLQISSPLLDKRCK